MVRSGPSGADRELIERLAALGWAVSVAQLERWRAAGLLPAHPRRWLGRGRGSVSVLEEPVVAVAAALARNARQGRDLRWTVLAWYVEAGRPVVPGVGAVPEPPWPAVREALLWAMENSRAYRVLARARTAGVSGSEEEQDAARDGFYADAARAFAQGPAATPDPAAMRRIMEGRADTVVARGEDARRRRGAVRLAAAAGMGSSEVGGALFVEALAALLPGLDWAPMVEAAEQAELDGTFGAWVPAAAVDPLALLVAADEQEMARARTRAQLLAGVGGLQLAYGLLMPDTPALASLRAAVDATGLGPLIRGMVPLLLTPSGVPFALAACLTPPYEGLATHVQGLLDKHARHGLLTPPNSRHPTAEAYMDAWLDHLRTAAASVAPAHEPGPGRRDVPDTTGEAGGTAANGGPAAGRGGTGQGDRP